MEAQAALVGPQRAGELHAEAAVDLLLAMVVHPGHAKGVRALRLGDHLQHLEVLVLALEERH